MIRKAHKSTKSTDDGPSIEKDTELPNQLNTTSGIPLTRRERCKKIIEQAFGTGEEPEQAISEQYFSNKVNIEDTKREIQAAELQDAKMKLEQLNMKVDPVTPDDRQCGLFKMSRELIKDDEEKIVITEDATTKANLVESINEKEAASAASAAAAEAATAAFTEEKTAAVTDKETVRETHIASEDIKASHLANAKENQAMEDHYRALFGEKEDVFRDDVEDDRAYDKMTTAKEENEKLAQKLETIEETPLVEAHKPGIEGFNVNPKILGDQHNEPVVNSCTINNKQDSYPKVNLTGDLDEMAKRCLKGPLGQVDEMLLKEMKNLDNPLTCQTGNEGLSPFMEDELVNQMNVCNKQQTNEEILSKNDEDQEHICDGFYEGPGSKYHMISDTRLLPDLNEMAEEAALLDAERELNEKVEQKSDHNEMEHVTKDSETTTKLRFERIAENYEEEIDLHHSLSPLYETNMNQDANKEMHKHRPNVFEVKPIPVHNAFNETAQALLSENQDVPTPGTFRISERYADRAGDDKLPISDEINEPENNPAMNPIFNPQIYPSFYQAYHNFPAMDPRSNAARDNIRSNEQNSQLNFGVQGNLRYGTIYPSDFVEPEQRTLEEKEAERKNTFYSRYLESLNAWDHHGEETSASKVKQARPQDQPTTIEDQAKLNQSWFPANRFIENSPYNMQKENYNRNTENVWKQAYFTKPLPNKLNSAEETLHNLNQKPDEVGFSEELMKERSVDYSPNVANFTQSHHKTLHSAEGTQNLQPEKVALPEELLMEHELNPCYVLTCNETCPIAPGPAMSTCKCTDFVDTSETIYMKKNIFESPRPKLTQAQEDEIKDSSEILQPKIELKQLFLHYENLTAERERLDENLNVKETAQPEIDDIKLLSSNKNLAKAQEHINKINETMTQPETVATKESEDTTVPVSDLKNTKKPAIPKIDATKQMNETMRQPKVAMNESVKTTQPEEEIIIVKESTIPTIDISKQLSNYENLAADAQENTNEMNETLTQPKTVATKESIRTNKIREMNETLGQRTQSKTTTKDLDYKPQILPHDKVSKPKIKPAVASPEFQPLPKPAELSLTELLKQVRERNRMRCTSNVGLEASAPVGKCPRPGPRCNPMAPRSPPLNPVPPPPMGLPAIKRRPPVCKPKPGGKGGCAKNCTACDMDVVCGVCMRENCPEIACEFQEQPEETTSTVVLTDVVLERIQNLSQLLGGVLRQVKSNFETLLARDFDPWSPIPSWPTPKPVEKQKWMPGYSGVPPCVKGCPVFPKARASMNPDPPCPLKPCDGFPKRRSFSSLDCFAVSLEDKKLYDLGQF